MIDQPEVAQTPAQAIAVIRLTIPRDEIRQVMGPGINELMTEVANQGIAITGPWFTHHLREPTDTFDFEIGVPVAAPVEAAGRVRPGTWPTMKVARTVYRGGYEGLPQAWGAFSDWIAQQGHRPAGDLWECYTRGPESGNDPAQWQTQLNRPLQ